MSGHVSMTPRKYAVLCLACHPLPLDGSLDALRRRISAAAAPFDPALAAEVARMSARQVQALRAHFQRLRDAVECPGGEAAGAAVELSISEWRSVAGAAGVALLRGGDGEALREGLLRELAERDPALAAKIGRLDAAQAASLLRRVRSGSRWCP